MEHSAGKDAGTAACLSCNKSYALKDLVDVGEGFYCRECIGEKILSSEETHPLSRPNREYEDLGVSLVFFLVIGFPIGASFLGWPNFFLGFLGMVHEMGHFVTMIFTAFLPGRNVLLVILAGSFFEVFVPFASFALVYPNKRLFVVACLFLAAFGTALADVGRYMGTAQNPSGYAFISGQPMTYQNHDWSITFSMLGLMGHASKISGAFYAAGRLMEYLGFYAAVIGLFGLGGVRAKVFLYAAIASVAHSLLVQQYAVAALSMFAGMLLVAYMKSE